MSYKTRIERRYGSLGAVRRVVKLEDEHECEELLGILAQCARHRPRELLSEVVD